MVDVKISIDNTILMQDIRLGQLDVLYPDFLSRWQGLSAEMKAFYRQEAVPRLLQDVSDSQEKEDLFHLYVRIQELLILLDRYAVDYLWFLIPEHHANAANPWAEYLLKGDLTQELVFLK